MPRPSCSIIALLVVVLLLTVYLSSYLILTLAGQYEFVKMDETLYVKRFEWAPRGFVVKGEWNGWVKFFYFPLYRLDETYWHLPSSEAEKFVPMPKPVVILPLMDE